MKKFVSTLLCIVLLTGIIPAVGALSPFSVTVTSDKDRAAVGEIVTLSINLSGTEQSKSGSLDVKADDGLQIMSGEMIGIGSIMKRFDVSACKGVVAYQNPVSFDGEYAYVSIKVLENTPQKITVTVKLSPSGTERSAEVILNEEKTDPAKIEIGSGVAQAGGMVTLDTILTESPRIKSLAISDIEFNAEVLEITDVVWTLEDAPIAKWDGATGMGAAALRIEQNVNGKIFGLTFKISDEAEAGEYPVTLKVILKDKTGKIIPSVTIPGLVTVDPCALGHDFGEWTVVTAATCTENGTEERVCSRCNEKESRETDALGHSYSDVVTDPTCTEQGYTTHTCAVCGESYIDSYVDALGHDFGEWTVVTAATCTEKGTEERICSRCNEKESREADALGHDFGADGSAETCSRCGEKNPDYKPPVNFKDVKPGAYYADAVAWAVENNITAGTSATSFSPDEGCTRGQVVTFLWRAAGSPEPAGSKNPFRDVKSDAYYYKAVLWAVQNKITSGTSATTFSPDDVCTRGQIVTFQWRANGLTTPKNTKNPFKDVKSSDYFYSAVLWAVENNITLGTDATHFSPSDTCTRGQIVTFLYRAK